MNLRFSTACLGASLLLGLLLTGCGPEEVSRKQANDIVQDVAGSFGDAIGDVSSGKATLKPSLKEAAEADRAKIKRSEPPYDAIIDAAYSEVEYQYRLTAKPEAESVLTFRGDEVHRSLSNLEAHALDVEPFERDAIEKALSEARSLDEKIDEIRAVTLTAEEQKAAVEWLAGKRAAAFRQEGEFSRSLFVSKWLEQREAGRLKKKREELQSLATDWAEVRVKLERVLARNMARYAHEMKHFKLQEPFIHPRHDDYWSDPITDGRRPDEAKGPYRAGQVWRQAVQIARKSANKAEILQRRIRQSVIDVLSAEDKKQATAAIEALRPAHPQYKGLVDAYEQYREYVSNGGWEKVPVTPGLRPGVTHERVETLKKRLRTEGHFPGDVEIDKEYGDALESAIRSYQQTHQMEVTGEPHSMFWASLNTSARERARQIALNLQRWRDSKVDHSDDLYVLVNIPDFHVEVWKNQARAMRFPIVVGNHDAKRVKPTNDRGEVIKHAPKETVYPNHTPTFSAYIDRVIYNPYWNVTDRIREEEVLPKVRKSVVASYKEKLRGLKEKALEQQKQKKKEAQKPGTASVIKDETDEAAPPTSLVATTEASDSEEASETTTEQESNEGGPFANRRSESDEPDTGAQPDAGVAGSSTASQSAEQNSNESNDSTSDTSDNNSAAAALSDERQSVEDLPGLGSENKGDKAKESPEKRDISEYISEEKVTVDKEREIEEMRVVFDIKKVRDLLQQVHGKDKQQKEASAEGKTSGSTETPSKEKSEKKEKKENQETLLEKHFPYLDAKKGWVDVSSTDPDHIPTWYAENYYEVVFPGRKWEYVRVIPGAHNALGRVKVIFPNKHSVYLHDTPKKHLFSRNLRAFSHGCMRMEKPLDFAEFLLRQDGLYEKQNVDQLLKGERVPWKKFKKENNFKVDDPEKVIPANRLIETSSGYLVIDYEYRPIFLENLVPVHVEYFTVRIDQQGRPHFLADIYDKDEKILSN